MLEKILKQCYDEEDSAIETKSAESIKTAVLSRIEEDKPMKHFKIKPLIIAAIITAIGSISFVTANAATDGAVVESIKRTFSFTLNGEEIEGTVTEYTTEDGETAERYEFDLPEDAAPYGVGIVLEGEDGGMTILNGDEVVYSEGTE